MRPQPHHDEPISPDEINVDGARLDRARDVLRRGVDENAFPGAVVCALRRGQIFLHEAVGTLDGERPAATSTIYDLASLTKPLATAASTLVLAEQGRLALAAALPAFLGEAAGHLSGVTLLHLLTHTSGLPAWAPLHEKDPGIDAAVASILRLPAAPPGTKYEYSCLGFILLGKIIEVVSGQPLDVFARENVFAPLGLEDTGYRPDVALHGERIAPTRSKERVAPDEDTQATLVGVVHDGNARALGGVSGNAGLFGTARDVARFGDAVRQGGPCGQRFFGAPTTLRCLENQIRPDIGAHTLLFFAGGNPLCPAGDLLSSRAVGHSGFTGTILTLDPQYDLTVALLTNRVLSDPEGARWLSVRRRFLNALAAALC